MRRHKQQQARFPNFFYNADGSPKYPEQRTPEPEPERPKKKKKKQSTFEVKSRVRDEDPPW
jgi:hypothetical protein